MNSDAILIPIFNPAQGFLMRSRSRDKGTKMDDTILTGVGTMYGPRMRSFCRYVVKEIDKNCISRGNLFLNSF